MYVRDHLVLAQHCIKVVLSCEIIWVSIDLIVGITKPLRVLQVQRTASELYIYTDSNTITLSLILRMNWWPLRVTFLEY